MGLDLLNPRKQQTQNTRDLDNELEESATVDNSAETREVSRAF